MHSDFDIFWAAVWCGSSWESIPTKAAQYWEKTTLWLFFLDLWFILQMKKVQEFSTVDLNSTCCHPALLRTMNLLSVFELYLCFIDFFYWAGTWDHVPFYHVPTWIALTCCLSVSSLVTVAVTLNISILAKPYFTFFPPHFRQDSYHLPPKLENSSRPQPLPPAEATC